jgi:hypothetical protein
MVHLSSVVASRWSRSVSGCVASAAPLMPNLYSDSTEIPSPDATLANQHMNQTNDLPGYFIVNRELPGFHPGSISTSIALHFILAML